jgi:hypothetical protein
VSTGTSRSKNLVRVDIVLHQIHSFLHHHTLPIHSSSTQRRVNHLHIVKGEQERSENEPFTIQKSKPTEDVVKPG